MVSNKKKLLLLTLTSSISLCAFGVAVSFLKKQQSLPISAVNEKTVTLTSFKAIKSEIAQRYATPCDFDGHNMNVPISDDGSYILMTWFCGSNMKTITYSDDYLVNGLVENTQYNLKIQLIFNLQNIKRVEWKFRAALTNGYVAFSPTDNFYDSGMEKHTFTSSELTTGSYTCTKSGQSFINYNFQAKPNNTYYRMVLESLSFTYDYNECLSSLS